MFNTSFFKKFKFWGVEDYTPNEPQESLDSVIYQFNNQLQPTVKNEYRLGMWVRTTQGKPAIVYRIEQDGLIVHHVDNQTGETTDEMKVSYNDVRQCKYLEIPEVRRGFTEETARKLGYGS
jgi:hypothetical protein